MALKMGYKGSVGMAQETAYGTAVTPSDFVEFNSESLKEDRQKMPIEAINATASLKKLVSLGSSVTGDVVFPVNPDDVIGMVLKAFMGKAPVSAQIGTSIAYNHTFIGANDFLADGVEGCGLTVQVNRDVNAIDYTGCLPNTIKLDITPNGLLICTASLIGQSSAINGSPTSPTFSTLSPFIFSQGSMTKAGAPIEVISASITMSNRCKADNYLLGQSKIKRPSHGGRLISGQITIFCENDDDYDDFLANTARELKLTFTGSVISGANSYGLAITLGTVYFTNNPTANINSKGVLVATVPFTSIYDDGTDQDIKVVLTNTATAY